MKKIIILQLLLILTINLFSNDYINMNSFKKRRVSYYCNQDINNVQKLIQQDLESILEYKEDYDEELYLTLENNLLIEKINFMPTNENTKKEIYLFLNNQILKNELFISNKNLKKLSCDYLVSVADLKTRQLDYLSAAKMYAESMQIKDLYLMAIKNDKKSPTAMMGYALWLYFAPPIVGGGYKESYKKFQEAEKKAILKEDLYFVLIYKSQLLLKMNHIEEARNCLKKANSLFVNETFTESIEEMNEKGILFFD